MKIMKGLENLLCGKAERTESVQPTEEKVQGDQNETQEVPSEH